MNAAILLIPRVCDDDMRARRQVLTIDRRPSMDILSLFEAMKRVQVAQIDAEKADVLCQNDDYERCWQDVKTELIECDRIADRLGIDLNILARAMTASPWEMER